MLLEDSLRGLDLVRREEGPVVDVGSGGGAPGIPLAARSARARVRPARGERAQVRLPRASSRRRNARVVHGRAEEQETDWAGCAVAKALAPPPVAAEWCLPLVRPGGAVVLWVGPTADAAAVASVAERLAARLEESPAGFLVLRKARPDAGGVPAGVSVLRGSVRSRS